MSCPPSNSGESTLARKSDNPCNPFYAMKPHIDQGSILFVPEIRFRGVTEMCTCSFCIFCVPEAPHVLRLCDSVFGKTFVENSCGFLTEKYIFGVFTHFEFPALRNSSCHWSLKLPGDDLHLVHRQDVVC